MNDQGQPELMRLNEVLERSGWSAHYVDKLVENKVLSVRRDLPGGWRFFYRREVEGLLTPPARTNNH